VSESVETLADLNAEAEDDCDTYDIRLAAVPDVEKRKTRLLRTEPAATSAYPPRSVELVRLSGRFHDSWALYAAEPSWGWVADDAAQKTAH
jgi:hypothetical protein